MRKFHLGMFSLQPYDTLLEITRFLQETFVTMKRDNRAGAGPPRIVFDDDNPEWTEEDFARARTSSEVLPPEILAAFGKRRADKVE